jgi:hypothetical protein
MRHSSVRRDGHFERKNNDAARARRQAGSGRKQLGRELRETMLDWDNLRHPNDRAFLEDWQEPNFEGDDAV